MNAASPFNYFFRKSPLVRTLCWIAFILLFAAVTLLIGLKVKEKPEITRINPPIGSPGDIVIITGKDFGAVRDTGYVEFGGSRLTSSSYISWNDNEIKVVLPANVQDGLVIVGTKNSRSKPSFFANASAVPVTVSENPESSMPLITEFTPERLSTGELLVISGSNFGNTRNKSKVYFSIDRGNSTVQEDTAEPAFIAANENDFDYEYWSDSEIRVHIPDGASSGSMYIENARGKSVQRKISIDSKAGVKKFSAPKTYLIQVTADIENSSGDKDSAVILHCPRPQIASAQPVVSLTECSPEPVIADYRNTIIHQIQGTRAPAGKKRFIQNFAVTVYETNTTVNQNRLMPYSTANKMLIAYAAKPDDCVPSNDDAVKELAAQITKSEKNPYNMAKLIYNYMVTNFVVLQNVRSGKISPLDLIRTKKGDAYDFAVIYTALLRASGIPALPDSGVLINPDLKTRNHWWCEFYLPGFGWVPVDPALGAGLEYQTWAKNTDARNYYFGNLDAQHILFSRGWNEIKPGSQNNKTVQRPRSFALQSIWEESSGKTVKYSSYWADPVIIGVY